MVGSPYHWPLRISPSGWDGSAISAIAMNASSMISGFVTSSSFRSGTAQPDLAGGRKMGTGSPEEITDDLKRLRDQGYKSVIFRYPEFDAAEQTRQFDVLADKIMPKI